MSIDKQLLLTMKDLPPKQVDTPEWEPDFPHVFVRKLGAEEKISMDAFNENEDGTENKDKEVTFLWRFPAVMLCQEDGSRLYDDAEAEGGILRNKNPDVLERILKAAFAHNRMTKEAREQAAKNSESGQTDSNT